MFGNVLLWANVGILVFLVASLMLFIIAKRSEKKDFHPISDMLTAALTIFGIVLLFDTVLAVNDLGHFVTVFEGINLGLLSTGISLILLPLLGVLFFVVMLSMRELS